VSASAPLVGILRENGLARLASCRDCRDLASIIDVLAGLPYPRTSAAQSARLGRRLAGTVGAQRLFLENVLAWKDIDPTL